MSEITAHSSLRPDPYDVFLAGLQGQFETRMADPAVRLFTTEGDETLFTLFLSHIPADERQHYTCNACRRFVNRFGGLVTIDENGNTSPVMWQVTDDTPILYRAPVQALRNCVAKKRVSGVFISDEKVWGTPVTGEWTHMAVTPPRRYLYRGVVKTAGQAQAEKREDFRAMIAALQELPLEAIEVAVRLLDGDALFRSEKVLGVATWLKALHEARDRAGYEQRANILWRAVASAPAGFCHPRSSMIGTLLDDIVAKLPFEQIERRFRAKMDPLFYQRAQSAPGAQNIQRAEEIVAKLGIARSLKRRYARQDEITTIWTPKQPVKTTGSRGGVFASVRAKDEPAPRDPLQLPATRMTVDKFRRTVLANALQIQFLVPVRGNFTALVTAEHMDAPPILQWDVPDARNPVSSYVYDTGSFAGSWGLTATKLCKVTAVAENPSQWNPAAYRPHMSQGLIFVLEGARDGNWQHVGSALFKENLIHELREVGKTIEAYQKSAQLGGYDEASACGLQISAGSPSLNHWFRVTTDTTVSEYILDRWD